MRQVCQASLSTSQALSCCQPSQASAHDDDTARAPSLKRKTIERSDANSIVLLCLIIFYILLIPFISFNRFCLVLYTTYILLYKRLKSILYHFVSWDFVWGFVLLALRSLHVVI